jgi:fructokinase
VDAVYFGTLGQREKLSRTTIRNVLALARKRNILRVLDVNLRRPFYDAALIRESIALSSILKLSDDELPEVAAACGVTVMAHQEATLQALRERQHLDCIVMTCGAKGALMVSAEETITQPGIPTEVVDTVGAGDAFTAAFVLGLLCGQSSASNLKASCEIASAVCSQVGAVPKPK